MKDARRTSLDPQDRQGVSYLGPQILNAVKSFRKEHLESLVLPGDVIHLLGEKGLKVHNFGNHRSNNASIAQLLHGTCHISSRNPGDCIRSRSTWTGMGRGSGC